MNSLPTIPGHKIIRLIGEGGMGTVFLALDENLQRQVAVKALKPNAMLQEENMKRFRTEAVTLARLRHPSITMLYNLLQVRGVWCMIMEYVEGETVEDRLKRHGALTVSETLYIAIQTLGALQHAHEKGVIHRDLKPSNLMLSADGEVKIMDFGIARIKGHTRMTKVGQAVGTPQYMSPEQVRGKEGDSASDIYSLGVVMYELLTGATPFASDSEFDTLQAHINRKPTPLSKNVPAALNNAVMRALAKEPSRRFANAAEFRVCLEEIAAMEKTPLKAPKWTPPHLTLPIAPLNSLLADVRSYFQTFIKSLPSFEGKRTTVGFGLLAASFIIALLALFYKSPAPAPTTAHLSDGAADTLLPPLLPIIEEPANVASSIAENPLNRNKQIVITTPSDDDVDKKAKKPEPKRPDSETKRPPKSESKPATPSGEAKESPPPATEKEPSARLDNQTVNSLARVVVINRGTAFIDLRLDEALYYETATDRQRISLTVSVPLVRSDLTVVNAGAKASAIVRKNARRQELVIEVVDIESVTGQRLGVMNNSAKAVSFAKGRKFNICLDYNRIIPK